MKKYLFMFALLATVFSFSACSDDDEEFDVNQLEGTWGLIRDQGWDIYEGEKEEWNDTYDPANPTDDCEKMVISKNDDGSYTVRHQYYYNGQWNSDSDTESFKLEGRKLIPLDGGDGSNVQLASVSSTQLVIEVKYKDETEEGYNKMTYKKM